MKHKSLLILSLFSIFALGSCGTNIDVPKKQEITIGENGNWFIDGVDTGHSSKGDKGDTGEKGDTGAKGDKGDKGDTGAKGDKGEAGSNTGTQGPAGADGSKILTADKEPTLDIGNKGDVYIDTTTWDVYKKGETWTKIGNIKGEKGEAGAAGAKGEKGDKGDTGANGAQGPAGAKGDKGDTGAAGAKGDKGDTGASGANGSQILTGNGVPNEENGKKGDIYIDTVTYDLYKKESTWTKIGNIKGEKGDEAPILRDANIDLRNSTISKKNIDQVNINSYSREPGAEYITKDNLIHTATLKNVTEQAYTTKIAVDAKYMNCDFYSKGQLVFSTAYVQTDLLKGDAHLYFRYDINLAFKFASTDILSKQGSGYESPSLLNGYVKVPSVDWLSNKTIKVEMFDKNKVCTNTYTTSSPNNEFSYLYETLTLTPEYLRVIVCDTGNDENVLYKTDFINPQTLKYPNKTISLSSAQPVHGELLDYEIIENIQ